MADRKHPTRKGMVWAEEYIDLFQYIDSPTELPLDQFLDYLKEKAGGMTDPKVFPDPDSLGRIMLAGYRTKAEETRRRKLARLNEQAHQL